MRQNEKADTLIKRLSSIRVGRKSHRQADDKPAQPMLIKMEKMGEILG